MVQRFTEPKTRLILIEGTPGSGKTTAARFTNDRLSAAGWAPRLYLEGNLDHPADFEGIAVLDQAGFEALVKKFPQQKVLLNRNAVQQAGEYRIGYRKLREDFTVQQLPEDLFQALARFDVYDRLSESDYLRLSGQRWEEFAAGASNQDGIDIFECCFWQNPLTVLLGRHNTPIVKIRNHITRNTRAVAPLNPLLIYLDPGDVKQTLARAAQERPREWVEGVTGYTTGQGYGKAAGLKGFEGMARFYEVMRASQLVLFDEWPGSKLFLADASENWQQTYRKISAFLETTYPFFNA